MSGRKGCRGWTPFFIFLEPRLVLGWGVLKVSHTSAWSDPDFTYCFSALLIWILGGFNFNFKKYCIKYYLSFFNLAVPWGLRDLSSPTTD